jgi:predicted nucleic acid-binding protein
MNAYLFDTSAILAHHLGESGWQEVERALLQTDAAFFICAITLVEFNSRLVELGEPAAGRRKILNDYRSLISEILPVDEAVAMIALHLRETVRPRLPLSDALIAACAKQQQATLIHRDPHFRGIPRNYLKQIELPEKHPAS